MSWRHNTNADFLTADDSVVNLKNENMALLTIL